MDPQKSAHSDMFRYSIQSFICLRIQNWSKRMEDLIEYLHISDSAYFSWVHLVFNFKNIEWLESFVRAQSGPRLAVGAHDRYS